MNIIIINSSLSLLICRAYIITIDNNKGLIMRIVNNNDNYMKFKLIIIMITIEDY